jgi:hypothetical protein
VGISGRGEAIRKRGWKENIVEIFCIHVCKWKNETCSNYFRNGGDGNKGGGGGGGVNSTMIYCKKFCKCHNVPLVQQ